ncbi:DUF2971 domain-containing protein [Rhodococcus sp. NPDC059234]|uniref:DUF2971 domain-containing protein n=1 Tax=Rhodococcus sp. NPDC059234 TaxID=3346781 RepID=UPI003673284D
MQKAYTAADDGEVHHYTDTTGLIGIIQGKKLWATNIQFLNDSLEYDFGLQRVTDALRNSFDKLKTAESADESSASELEKSLEVAIGLLEGKGGNPKDGQFVCCLSNFGDDLGQWRGYAQEGYCITFDRDELTESIAESQDDERSVRHGNVTYGPGYDWGVGHVTDEVLSRMHEIVSDPDVDLKKYRFLESDPTFGEIVRDRNRPLLASITCIAAVQSSIPFQKEDGFVNEQEMRLCVSHPGEVKFRPSKIGPIPYVELEFNPASIKAVTVGPGLNIELRQSTLEYLLAHEFGKDHTIEVKKTALSFRG